MHQAEEGCLTRSSPPWSFLSRGSPKAACYESLRLKAKKAQRTFGSGFLNVGYLAACLRDNYPYEREAVYMTKPLWEPIFEPDASCIGLLGDGLIKINQAVPGYVTRENLRDLTGIEPGA